MTRQIICSGCADEIGDRYGLKAPSFEGVAHPESMEGPAEHVKLVPGEAKARYMCDICGQVISLLERCWGYSIWTATHPYHPWETEFLVLPEGEGSGRSDSDG